MSNTLLVFTNFASVEYSTVAFFVIYMAIINGAESAGTLLSFGPSKFPLMSNVSSSC